MNHFVMYNSSDVIWCYEEEMHEKLTLGWKLYGYAATEEKADQLCEEAENLPL